MLGACTDAVRRLSLLDPGDDHHAGTGRILRSGRERGSAGGRVGVLYKTGANFPVERIDCTVLGTATIHQADYSCTLELNALDSPCVCPTDKRYLTHRLHGATC